MSKAIVLSIEALEPLVITDGTTEGMKHQCLDFIPGNMILGALASRWIKMNAGKTPDETQEFQGLFLSSSTRYLNAYPKMNNSRTWPSPLTLKHIKNHPSLPGPSSAIDPLPAITNSLAFVGGNAEDERTCAREVGKLTEETSVQLKKVKPAFMCPETKIRAEIHKSWEMHVAIDHTKRRHADKQLFGYQAISSGAVFESAILFEDDALCKAMLLLLRVSAEFQVGHARSAGYGRVRFNAVEKPEYLESSAKNLAGELRVMLLSDYIPCRSWADPLESLKTDLTEKLDAAIEIVEGKNFCAYREVQGFNSHWRLPRATRMALMKGSVVTLEINSGSVAEAQAKAAVTSGIGGCRNEGYGRIAFNPKMLEENNLEFKILGTSQDQTSGIKVTKPSTALTLLRKRAIRRIADQAARDFLSDSAVTAFLKDADPSHRKDLSSPTKPTNSQLANIRAMVSDMSKPRDQWVKHFEHMLNKTSAKQWTTCRVKNFMLGHKIEHFSMVMMKLLDMSEFKTCSSFGDALDRLPGGPPSKEERIDAEDRIHRLAVAGLMEAIVTIRHRGEGKEATK